MPPRVVLVGPMGAGKSTVAGLLGDVWDLPVRDTDADIEAHTDRARIRAKLRERSHKCLRVLRGLRAAAGVRDLRLVCILQSV